MNRYVVEFQAVSGKGDEAIALLHEMKAYFQEVHQKSLEIFYLAFGTPGTFQAMMDLDNLAQLDTLSQAIRHDPRYRALSERVRGILVHSSMKTAVYYRL